MKPSESAASAEKTGFFPSMHGQVLIAILLGIAVGALWPGFGASLKPLGDAFIKLVKMVIAPVIFLTVTTGIAGMGELKAVGRVAAKAFLYFFCLSTFALILGLIVAELAHPGTGMHVSAASLDTKSVADYVEQSHEQSVVGFLMALIPDTMLSALTSGSILQTLFLAVLAGIAISLVGARAKPVSDLLDQISLIVFRIVGIVMRAAPVGTFGAMAFTIGKYGVRSLIHLGALVGCFFLTAFLFVAIVLWLVARLNGFSIWALLRYLKAELLLVLGTSSSEAALPSLIQKMEDAGCDKAVVGLVVPTGYSFNLDGTNIYMTLAALFIAQALDVHLTLGQEALLLSVAMLSSKGAAGVTGAGFITLAATLSIVPDIPVGGMALILGVDRFMSQGRSLTNFIGNAVATIVVARWEGALDKGKLDAALKG